MSNPLGGILPDDGYYFWLENAVDGSPVIMQSVGVTIGGKTLYKLVPLYQLIILPRIESTAILYPGMVSPEQGVALPIIGPGSAVFAPTVTQAQLVSLATIASGSVLHAPSIISDQSISLGTIASGSTLFPPALITIVDLTEPWGEVARQETITSGRLILSGLDLSNLIAVRLHINGVRVTSDDSTVHIRFIIGSEISAGYDWANAVFSATGTLGVASGASSDSKASMTNVTSGAGAGLGNDATESLHGTLTVFDPAGSQPKAAMFRGSYLNPSGVAKAIPEGIIYLPSQTSPINGFIVYASSDLVAGSLVLLGLE